MTRTTYRLIMAALAAAFCGTLLAATLPSDNPVHTGISQGQALGYIADNTQMMATGAGVATLPAANPQHTGLSQGQLLGYIADYTQDIAANGSGPAKAVRGATTANITIATALNNGDTLDGLTLATGDRVLVKNQTTTTENGIYVVGSSPARAADADAWSELPGLLIIIEAGTVNKAKLYAFSGAETGTLGSTAITFSEKAAGGGGGGGTWGSITGDLVDQTDLYTALGDKLDDTEVTLNGTFDMIPRLDNLGNLLLASGGLLSGNAGASNGSITLYPSGSASGSTAILASNATAARTWDHPDASGTYASQEWAGNADNISSGTVAAGRLGSGTIDGATVLYSDNVWRPAGDVYLGSANAFTAQGNSFAFSPRWTFNALSGVTVSTTSTLQVGAAYQGSVSADRTFVFSGTPASGDTILTVLSVTNSPVLTIPSSRRAGEADSGITSVQLTAGKHWLQWTYDGTVWILRDSLAAVSTVANGGTGVSTLTAYAPIFGGTTSTGAVQSGTVGNAGEVLTSNGAGALPTWQAPASGSAPTVTSRRTTVSTHEEFFSAGTSSTAGIGAFGFIFRNTGSGSNNGGAGPADSTAAGVWQFENGTAAGGIGGISTDSGAIRFGGGTYTLEWRVRVPTLNDGTDTFTTRIGFFDTVTNSEATDGVYFRYSNANANWIVVCRQNSTESATTTTTSVVAGTWYKLRVVVTGTASAVFTINDADSTTISTNIPADSASRVTGIGATICRDAGSNERTLQADYASMDITFSSAR